LAPHGSLRAVLQQELGPDDTGLMQTSPISQHRSLRHFSQHRPFSGLHN
jgi:hypothetical protein